MKHLLEIAKIVTKKKVKKIEIFDDYTLQQKDSKFNEFYESLMNGAFQSDTDAAQHFYGSSSKHDKYRQLKSRFKKRLLNTLYFLDINQASNPNYERAYYSCHKDWTLVKILLNNKATDTANQMARQIYTTALKFHFSDLIVNAARTLRAQASADGNEKLFQEYDARCKEYLPILEAEMLSEEYLQKVELLIHSKNTSADAIQELIGTLSTMSASFAAPIIQYNTLLAKIAYAEWKRDYQALNAICEEAEAYMTEYPEYYQSNKFIFVIRKKILAIFHTNTWEDGQLLFEEYRVHFDTTEYWLTLMEYYILFAVKQKAYGKALELFHEVFKDKRYKKLKEAEVEKWQLIEIFLCFLQWNLGINRTKRYARFRLKRFLEEPIIVDKKKRILAVVTIIGQCLFLLEEQRLGEAFERIERLKVYLTKFLRAEEHFRSIQFIRLLQQLAKAHFDYSNIGIHQKYLIRLQETPNQYTGQLNLLEVIPYEDLWDMVLKSCAKIPQ